MNTFEDKFIKKGKDGSITVLGEALGTTVYFLKSPWGKLQPTVIMGTVKKVLWFPNNINATAVEIDCPGGEEETIFAKDAYLSKKGLMDNWLTEVSDMVTKHYHDTIR